MSGFSWTCCSWASFQQSQEAECKCQAFLLAGGENPRCAGLNEAQNRDLLVSGKDKIMKTKQKKCWPSRPLSARNAAFCRDSHLRKATSVWQERTAGTFSRVTIMARISIYFLHHGCTETFSFHLKPSPTPLLPALPQANHQAACILKIHFKFPSPSHGLCPTPPLCLSSLSVHFLMQRNNGAALRGGESLPKLCVGGLFLVKTSQPSSIQHSFFLPPSTPLMSVQDTSALWDFEDVILSLQRVKYGRGRRVQVPISQFGPSHALYVLDHHCDASKHSLCVISYLVLIFKEIKNKCLFFFPKHFHFFCSLFRPDPSGGPWHYSFIQKPHLISRKQPHLVFTAFHENSS